MSRRVNIKAILKDKALRRRLIAGVVRFLAAHEGRERTWAEAYALIDRKRT